MPQALLGMRKNFTAEHVALLSENPWQRLEDLNEKHTAADAEIERLEAAIAEAKAEYFALLAART
jgi:multidrug resistance efflux pump